MPALENTIAFTRDLCRDWTIDANSTFTSGSPAAHVQHSRPDVKARSTDTTSGSPAYIAFNSGTAGLIDPDTAVVYMLYISHDGDSGSLEYRVRIDDVDTFGSPSYDSGSGGTAIADPYADRNFSHALCNPGAGTRAAGQYIRIDLWATNASYIDIGRIVVGVPWQPERNVSYGGSIPSVIEDAIRSRGPRGHTFIASGRRYSSCRGNLIFTSESEARQFNDFSVYTGTNRPFVYHFDPNDATNLQTNIVYGTFERLQPMNFPAYPIWQTDFEIAEVR